MSEADAKAVERVHAAWDRAAEVADRRVPRRTPEAQAAAMQEVDRAAEQALHELRNAPTAYRSHQDGDVGPAEVAGLETVLSNAALADTPAVREMGGPATVASFELMFRAAREAMARNTAIGKLTDEAMAREECLRALERDAEFSRAAKDPNAIVLTGPEAASYRALQTAARKAQASAAAARADGAALLQLFQAFCAGLAPEQK